MENYRIRWMTYSGRYCIERRTERKALGFWPVYVWVLEGLEDTLRAAQDFVLNKRHERKEDQK